MMLRKITLRIKWMFNDFLKAFGVSLNTEKVSGEVRVLCFHGICEDHQEFINGRFLKQSQFAALIAEVSERFHVLTLPEYTNKAFKKDRLNVLITFDDGYRNNQRLALPILEQFEIPATVFCTAQERLWTDLIDIAIAEQCSPVSIHDSFSETNGFSLQEIKTWGIDQGSELLEGFTVVVHKLVERHLKEYPNFFELFSDDDLKQFGTHNLITLGNHGADHISYGNKSQEEIIADIEKVVIRFKKIGLEAPSVMAYPYGHYTDFTKEALSQFGYTVQFIADGRNKASDVFHDRLVVNPYISTRNQLIAIRDGKY